MNALDYETPKPEHRTRKLPVVGLVVLTAGIVGLGIISAQPVQENVVTGTMVAVLSLAYLAFRARRYQLLVIPFVILGVSLMWSGYMASEKLHLRSMESMQRDIERLERETTALRATTGEAGQPHP